MADQVYLSIWLRDFNESNMLQYWQRVLEVFPSSALLPGVRAVSIYPFSWVETPVFERSFGEEAQPLDAVSIASEFLHDDYAYEAEMDWDLWVQGDAADQTSGAMEEEQAQGEAALVQCGWHLVPSRVQLACLGPRFESDTTEERADIQIRLGLDSPFLPPAEEAAQEEDLDFDPQEAELRSRQNLQQLVGFVHRLDEVLPIERRVLWCESGENLAEKILKAVTGDE